VIEKAKYMCTMSRITQILRFFPQKLIGICAEDERDDEFSSVIDLLFNYFLFFILLYFSFLYLFILLLFMVKWKREKENKRKKKKERTYTFNM
jgi:hypothetical protein